MRHTDVLGPPFELGAGRFLERRGEGGDLVVVGAALQRRKHREVDEVVQAPAASVSSGTYSTSYHKHTGLQT